MSKVLLAVVNSEGSLEHGSSAAIVPWWSFTKTLIAVAALKLAEKRALALDEPVANRPYTPRQMLRHCAGLGDYGALADYHAAVEKSEEPWSDEEVFKRVPTDTLLYAPGKGWSYSNVGYLLLRRMVEKSYGARLDRVLADLILAPLNIANARVATTPQEIAAVALPPPFPYHPDWAFHGFVIGPVSEAALTLHRLFEGPFLSRSVRAALFDRNPLGGPLPGRPWTTIGYGTGTMMPTITRERDGVSIEFVSHSAGGPGSSGAVYQVTGGGASPSTYAAFSDSENEATAENAIAERVLNAQID
jgi:CubicO group peptidase (beta-lactamase class C family)